MPPTHTSSAGPVWHAALRHALLLGAVGYVGAQFAPVSFTIPALRLTKATVLGASAWAAWRLSRPQPRQTVEDLSTGFYVSGRPGSGKTGYLYGMMSRWASLGWPWISLSCKSTAKVLAYLPPRAEGNTIVVQPDSQRPIGLDLMRCYTDSPVERELVADQVAELYERLHPQMSALMRETIRLAMLALLTWAGRRGVQVTPWELYRLFTDQRFREVVLAEAPSPIRDGLEGDDVRQVTIQAVIAQLRRAVTSDSLLLSLCQPDGVDLHRWMQGGKGLVIDAPAGRIGPGVSAFLCQAVAARIQLLQERRPPESAPCLIALDEAQRYVTSTFASAVEVGREFRMCWVICHQTNSGQRLGAEVEGAIEMIGNHAL
jgi:hypothetical protein